MLGPSLFSIYATLLSKLIGSRPDVDFYADDTYVCVVDSNFFISPTYLVGLIKSVYFKCMIMDVIDSIFIHKIAVRGANAMVSS